MDISIEESLKNILEKYRSRLLSIEGVLDVKAVHERLRSGESVVTPQGKIRIGYPGSILIQADRSVLEMENRLRYEVEKILEEGYCVKLLGTDYGVVYFPRNIYFSICALRPFSINQ